MHLAVFPIKFIIQFSMSHSQEVDTPRTPKLKFTVKPKKQKKPSTKSDELCLFSDLLQSNSNDIIATSLSEVWKPIAPYGQSDVHMASKSDSEESSQPPAPKKKRVYKPRVKKVKDEVEEVPVQAIVLDQSPAVSAYRPSYYRHRENPLVVLDLIQLKKLALTGKVNPNEFEETSISENTLEEYHINKRREIQQAQENIADYFKYNWLIFEKN